MPTLNRRIDGLYFVRHFYGDHHTWQVSAEGARFLEFRGFREGSYFNTTLFMEMVVQGLVFTGQGPKPAFRGGTRSAKLPDAMAAIVKDFHRALVQGDVSDVAAFLWLSPELGAPPETIRQIAEELCDRDRRPLSWKLKDAVTYDMPASERPSFGGADIFTAVRVRLGTKEFTAEVTEHWFRTGDGWRVSWDFFPDK